MDNSYCSAYNWFYFIYAIVRTMIISYKSLICHEATQSLFYFVSWSNRQEKSIKYIKKYRN